MQISLCDVIHKNTKKMCRYLKNILKQKSMHTMYIYIQYIYIYIYIYRERERLYEIIYTVYIQYVYIYRYSSIFISIHVCVKPISYSQKHKDCPSYPSPAPAMSPMTPDKAWAF